MPQSNYNQVISEVKTLSLTDQLRLLEETAGFIRNNSKITPIRSILELRGKGKDIWKEVDVKKDSDNEIKTQNPESLLELKGGLENSITFAGNEIDIQERMRDDWR